jgi:hypothetical protein
MRRQSGVSELRPDPDSGRLRVFSGSCPVPDSRGVHSGPDGSQRPEGERGIIAWVTKWEYARLEYRAAGTLGTDRFMDWSATFHHPGGVLRWGTDERFDDVRHLNRAGQAGWEAYNRAAIHVHNEPHRLSSVTYSMRRPVP